MRTERIEVNAQVLKRIPSVEIFPHSREKNKNETRTRKAIKQQNQVGFSRANDRQSRESGELKMSLLAGG